ncbi:MAG: hypothetical protein ACK5MA_10990 [Parachlamydiaceae bacterium]
MKKSQSQIAALLAAIALGSFTFWSYAERQESKQQQDAEQQELFQQKLQIAESLIYRKHPQNALNLLKNNTPDTSQTAEERARWLELTLKSAEGMENQKLLVELYNLDPSLFTNRESLGLKIAAYYLQKDDFLSFDKIKSDFKSQPKSSPQWDLLTADALALQGQSDKARTLLESLRLQGAQETERLLRLALLAENEHPKYAFDKLTEALKNSPQNSDLHYYRAKLLQNSGHEELAQKEIEQALRLSPETPFYREELIDGYIEKGQWQQAYNALQSFYLPPSSGKIWLSALFLDKAYKPFPTHFDNRPIPEDQFTPLLRYLLTVGRDNYWNYILAAQQPAIDHLANQTTKALWLKLLNDLNIGHEKDSLHLLEAHPEMAALHPQLYEGLKQTLAFRLRTPSAPIYAQKPTEQKPHPLFTQLHSTPYSKELEKLLVSDEAFTAVLLAAGWNEAAIREHKLTSLPAEFPKWVAFSLTQALNENRGPEAALQFAYAQSETPQLSLLIGTLELKAHHKEKGIAILRALASKTNDVGVKAAKTLTDYLVSNKDWNAAYAAVTANDPFTNSLEGKERLAKIQLNRGKTEEAQALYQSILDQSSEAKSYYAALYFKQKNYQQALLLTRDLLKQFPYREDLKEQLALIEKAKSQAVKAKNG